VRRYIYECKSIRVFTCAKVYICLVNKRVRSDKNIGRARRTLPALAGSTVSWEDSFRFSVITANSLSQPRCAPSRVSVFYPEFGPRVPDDHPPASPPAFAAATRCPRRRIHCPVFERSSCFFRQSMHTHITCNQKSSVLVLIMIKIAPTSSICNSTPRGHILGRVRLKDLSCALLRITKGTNAQKFYFFKARKYLETYRSRSPRAASDEDINRKLPIGSRPVTKLIGMHKAAWDWL